MNRLEEVLFAPSPMTPRTVANMPAMRPSSSGPRWAPPSAISRRKIGEKVGRRVDRSDQRIDQAVEFARGGASSLIAARTRSVIGANTSRRMQV